MSTATPETYARDADVLEWFLRNRGSRAKRLIGTPYDPASAPPIARLIECQRRWARLEESVAVPGHESMTPGMAGSTSLMAGMCDLYMASAAAWCIRRLEGSAERGRIALQIDASFVEAELAARDSTAAADPALPGGLGTLLTAARCADLLEADIRIFGNRSRALDVEVVTAGGARLRFEQKTQAVAAAFRPNMTAEVVVDRALRDALVKARELRNRTKEDGVRACQAVCFFGLYPYSLQQQIKGVQIQSRIREVYRSLFGTSDPDPYALPHAATFFWLGVDLDGVRARAEYSLNTCNFAEARPRAPEDGWESFRAIYHVL